MYTVLINLMDSYYSSNSRSQNQRDSFASINEVLNRRSDELGLFDSIISLVRLQGGYFDGGKWIVDPQLESRRKRYLINMLMAESERFKDHDCVYFQIIGHGGPNGDGKVNIESFEIEYLFNTLLHYTGETRVIINILGTCYGDLMLPVFKRVCNEHKKQAKLLYNMGRAVDDDTPFLYLINGFVDKPITEFINGPGYRLYNEWASYEE